MAATRRMQPLPPERARPYRSRVGTIFYGDSATPIEIEDRALAHLKVVIATKLRRGESFTLSWTHPEGQEPGRSTVWLHPRSEAHTAELQSLMRSSYATFCSTKKPYL